MYVRTSASPTFISALTYDMTALSISSRDIEASAASAWSAIVSSGAAVAIFVYSFARSDSLKAAAALRKCSAFSAVSRLSVSGLKGRPVSRSVSVFSSCADTMSEASICSMM